MQHLTLMSDIQIYVPQKIIFDHTYIISKILFLKKLCVDKSTYKNDNQVNIFESTENHVWIIK